MKQADLEAAVSQLASEGSAASLVAQCLGTLDGIAASLDLFREVLSAPTPWLRLSRVSTAVCITM